MTVATMGETLAIEAWPARRVADLRDGVRFLRAWLMTLDDALTDAGHQTYLVCGP